MKLNDILKPYESRPGVQTWVGEHVGKFLHAAGLAFEYGGDARLKAKMDSAARRLVATQLPDGYLGTYLDDKRWTEWDVWSHKYNLIGLMAHYRISGEAASLAASRKMADLLCATFGTGKRNIATNGTHAGMAASSVLEPMVQLYRLTGDAKVCYFAPLDGTKPYGMASHGIPGVSCCSSSLPRGIAMIPFLGLGSTEGKPTVLLYGPGGGTVTARKEGGGEVAVQLALKTEFPRMGLVSLAVKPAATARFVLRLRVPDWSQTFRAVVGGRKGDQEGAGP